MKKLTTLFLIISIFTLVSCKDDYIPDIDLPEYNDSIEKLNQQYPDKTVLTWLVPSYFECHTPQSTEKLNQALVEKGADYVVYFKQMENQWFLDDNYPGLFYSLFAEQVIEYIDNGGQADIITTDFHFSGWTAPIYKLARENYLENLEDYLSTDKGKELYTAYPDIYWKAAEIEHSLYGTPIGVSTLTGLYNYYDKTLADKYGLDYETMSLPFYKMGEIFEKVYENEKENNPQFKIMPEATINMNPYGFKSEYLFLIDNIVAVNYNNPEIINIYNDNNSLEIIQIICEFMKLGWSADSSAGNYYGDFLINNTRKALYYSQYHSVPPYDSAPNNYYEVYSGAYPMENITQQLCISSNSENKEAAFDLIYRMQTDKELCMIMTDYIEGFDVLSDFSGVVNKSLCLPDKDGKSAKELMFEYSEELYIHPLLGFYADYTGLEMQISAVLEIKNYNYWTFDYGTYKVNDDFYDTATALTLELKEAGLDELIAVFTNQYNEWSR